MTGKIFINYRRGDDPGNTGRLFDRLQDAFASDQLFLDVDNIAPGLDFVRVLNERVAECDVVLAVIGKGWLDARDSTGARRLDDPDDFVRIEIASALEQGKRVIPVLVGEAQMPGPDELPEPIKPLARRNAVRLTHERFRADMQGLVKALRQTLVEFDDMRKAALKTARRTLAEERHKQAAQTATARDRRLIILAGAGALAVVLVAGTAALWFETTRTPVPAASTTVAPAAAPALTSVAPPPAKSVPAPPLPVAPVQSAPPTPSLDAVAWSLLKGTTDDDSLKRFVAQYPNSPFRKDADAQIATLEAAEAARVAAANRLEMTRAVQVELKRVGCYDGDVNGQFDDATKTAWRSFGKLANVGTSDEPTADSLKTLKSIDKRVCPLLCSSGQHAEGDSCIADVPPKRVTTEAPSQPARAAKPKPAEPKAHAKCFSFEGQRYCE